MNHHKLSDDQWERAVQRLLERTRKGNIEWRVAEMQGELPSGYFRVSPFHTAEVDGQRLGLVNVTKSFEMR